MDVTSQGYIRRKEKETSLYGILHEEALEILQKLSGAIWTDYNEHDPGVTLLENLAYSMTELSYKARLPIKDLLIPKAGKELTSGFNALFTASDILTTGPITFNDYRKILIDRIENVKNVWIHPVSDAKNAMGAIKGLFHVYVEKHVYWKDTEQESKDDLRIITNVREICHRHRNLCEDVYRLKIFKPFPFTMEFKITLTDEVDGEEVLAQIVYKVNNYLAPEVKYQSLWNLQKNKTPINEIFNGPSLPNGFILDEDLKDPLTRIAIPEIVALISRIPGVMGIPKFYLKYQDPETKLETRIDDFFDIPAYKIGRLSFPMANQGLVFENSGILFNPDLEETKKQLSFIQALDYGDFRRAASAMNKIPIPSGTYQEVNFYYPLRKQFPELYGIGDRGISNKATALRKAQVKQLKAYLMPFDQLMVNFLAQLQNVYRLYNIDLQSGSSYFTQDLPDIDELEELTIPPNYHGDIKKYRKVLFQRCNDSYDEQVLQRFNAISDHLLARFDETFQTYSLRKMNSIGYGKSLTSKKFAKELLEEKRKFIKEYGQISYNRAKSFDYHQLSVKPSKELMQASEDSFMPGAIHKIALLLGIGNFQLRSLTSGIADSSIVVKPRTKISRVVLGEIDIDTPEIHLRLLELGKRKINTTTKGDLRHIMHYVGNQGTILEDVLKNGVLKENYTVQKADDSDELYYVMYKRAPEKYNIAHISESKEEAAATIDAAIDYLITIGQKSEGFFVIEHLMLLPPYGGDYFGFCIDFAQVIRGVDLQVKHTRLRSCKKRNDVVLDFVGLLYAETLEINAVEGEDGYEIQFCTTDGSLSFTAENCYKSLNKAEQQIGWLKEGIQKIDRENFDKAIECEVYYGEHCVGEKFFSLQMSFIIPSWLVRFQNENFKKMFENTAYDQIPIHIGTSFFWLDVKRLRQFERSYFKWLELLKQKEGIKKRIQEAYKLILMLQEWSKKEEID